MELCERGVYDRDLEFRFCSSLSLWSVMHYFKIRCFLLSSSFSPFSFFPSFLFLIHVPACLPARPPACLPAYLSAWMKENGLARGDERRGEERGKSESFLQQLGCGWKKIDTPEEMRGEERRGERGS